MERFEFVANLGEGAYGTVWLCLDRETGQRVAMKRFKDAHTDEEVMRLALREIRMLKSCSHKNVVRLNEAFRSKSGRVYMVLEYVPRTLTEELRAHPRGFAPEKVKLYTYQLLQAAAYMHRSRLLHRDLKPANILISEAEEIKLCDFGFARMMVGKSEAEYTTYVVTRWYRAPEIIVNDAYGPAVDIWAIGCLFSEMACGRPLFPGRNSFDQLWLTMRCLGVLPERQLALMRSDSKLSALNVPAPEDLVTLEKRFPDFNPDMMQLLRGCLALDPAHRLTAEQAMELPYFDDVRPLLAVVEARKLKLQERLQQEAALVRAAAASGAPIATAAAMPSQQQQFVQQPAAMASQQAFGARPVHMPAPTLAASGWLRSQVGDTSAAAYAAPTGRPPIAPLPPHVAALAAAASAQAQQRQAAAAAAAAVQATQQQQHVVAVPGSTCAAAAVQQQQSRCAAVGACSNGSSAAGNGSHTPSLAKRTRSQSRVGEEQQLGDESEANTYCEPAAQRGRQSDGAADITNPSTSGSSGMQVDGSSGCDAVALARAAAAISAKQSQLERAPTGSPVSVLPDALTSAGSSGVHMLPCSKPSATRSLANIMHASAVETAFCGGMQQQGHVLGADGTGRDSGSGELENSSTQLCSASTAVTHTPWGSHVDMSVHVAQPQSCGNAAHVHMQQDGSLQSHHVLSSSHFPPPGCHHLAHMGSTNASSRRRSLGQAMRDIGHKLEALITRPFGAPVANMQAGGGCSPPLASPPPITASGKPQLMQSSSLARYPPMPLSVGQPVVVAALARPSEAGSL